MKSGVAGMIALIALAGGGCSNPSAQDDVSVARVTIVTPRREPMTRSITLTATLEPYEQVPLYAKVAGYVGSLNVDIGDSVSRGQLLATLEVPEMEQQYRQARSALKQREAELAKARAEADLRRVVFFRSKGLREKDAITQQDMDEARAHYRTARADVDLAQSALESATARVAEAQTLMSYSRLTSPFDGIVTRRFVDPGALVQTAATTNNATPVVTVAQTEPLRAFVEVPEPDARFVRRGESAVLKIHALSRAQFRGDVSRTADALDPATRTMRTEVDLANPAAELRPGMYGSLTFQLESHPRALTVPEAALHREGASISVFILSAGRILRRPVEIGLANDERVEVLSGLSDAASVVVTGSNLKPGNRAIVVGRVDRARAEKR